MTQEEIELKIIEGAKGWKLDLDNSFYKYYQENESRMNLETARFEWTKLKLAGIVSGLEQIAEALKDLK